MWDTHKNDKSDWLIRQLAAYFLSLQPGDNFKSVREMASEYSVSIGLVSESISSLEKQEVIKIERRGQLGSFLVEQSIGGLWNAAMQAPLVISHTLPSNRRYEGLSTGIKSCFTSLDIDSYFIFIRGSQTRLKALREHRCHIAIMSKFAAEGLISRGECISYELPPRSFTGSHQVFYRNEQIKPGSLARIAIDNDSYDQSRLSKIEFANHEMEWITINFMNIQRSLMENKVDIAIWTEEDMVTGIGNTIGCRSLSQPTVNEVQQKDTQAVFVVLAEDKITHNLLQKALDAQKILDTQQDVVNGNIIPYY